MSLAIIIWGWALYSRGYETAGGLVWGLLAFKPVWAAAFFLAPLLTRRWRACAAARVLRVDRPAAARLLRWPTTRGRPAAAGTGRVRAAALPAAAAVAAG